MSDGASGRAGTLTWRALWVETTQGLGAAADEARWICQAASGCEGAEWLDLLDRAATTGAVRRVDAMVARRRQGEPIQYVLGAWSFRRLDLFVDHRVLIPRPETELVAEVALELARQRPRPIVVADLGTGSGAIALSLAAELPITGVQVWATDASPAALDVARANLAGIGRPAANVRLAEGDWFDALPSDLRGRLDLVVANPPYVATTDHLDEGVRAWEPMAALLAGPDGLDDLRRLIADAPAWLAPGAALVLEIGAAQGLSVAALGRSAGFTDIEIRPDLAGRDRIATLRGLQPLPSPDPERLTQKR